MDKTDRELMEKFKESNWKFVKAVEQVMDDYRNQRLTTKQVVEKIEKIENKYG